MQRIVSSKDKRVALYLFLVDTIGSTAPTTTTLLIPTSWVTVVTQNLFAINFF